MASSLFQGNRNKRRMQGEQGKIKVRPGRLRVDCRTMASHPVDPRSEREVTQGNSEFFYKF